MPWQNNYGESGFPENSPDTSTVEWFGNPELRPDAAEDGFAASVELASRPNYLGNPEVVSKAVGDYFSAVINMLVERKDGALWMLARTQPPDRSRSIMQSLSQDAGRTWSEPRHLGGVSGYSCEFDDASGRTDVIATDGGGEGLAFEAKLESWRGALIQAHRNRCFAHRSYVVVPAATAYRAMRFEAEFRRRGVGICLVSRSGLVELIPSHTDAPCLECLRERALGVVQDSMKEVKSDDRC